MTVIDITAPQPVTVRTPSGDTQLVSYETFTPPDLRAKLVEASTLISQWDVGSQVGADIETFARSVVDDPTFLDGVPPARLAMVVRGFRDYAPLRPGDGSPVWLPGIAVSPPETYAFDGVTYRVVQAHTTQAGWEPPNAPALFAVV